MFYSRFCVNILMEINLWWVAKMWRFSRLQFWECINKYLGKYGNWDAIKLGKYGNKNAKKFVNMGMDF